MYDIRYATINDARILAQIHSTSWKVAYKGIVPNSVLDNITVEKREKHFEQALKEEREKNAIIFKGNKPAGLICIGKCRDSDQDDSCGEIWGIYLHPDYWNMGIGLVLLKWGLDELTKKGYKKATLWVLEDNLSARKFYEKAGFKHDGLIKEIKVGKVLNEYRYEIALVKEKGQLKEVHYKELEQSEINMGLFASFKRHQEVKKCWRKENGNWVLKDIAFTEYWSADEYKDLIKFLHNTLKTGGKVFGAFHDGMIVGFASVENKFFGYNNEYLQLSSLHTSYGYRGMGIGKKLFNLSCEQGIAKGAKKLYISAHSAEETQAFYKAMGCSEAVEYNERLVAEEPYDCQLEYSLV